MLLPGQIPLHRIEAPLDHLADNVRGHEVHSPRSLRESLMDTLQEDEAIGLCYRNGLPAMTRSQ